LAKADAVQRQPCGIPAGQGHRDGEQPPPVVPGGLFEFGHPVMETFLLRQLGGIQSALRQQPLFPQAVAIDALLRRGAQVALVVDRPLRRREPCSTPSSASSSRTSTASGPGSGR
jgi:hypothetical protein